MLDLGGLRAVLTRVQATALRRALPLVTAFFALGAEPAVGRETPRFPARAGLDLAAEAALAWSPDARLVYVENDEPVDEAGGAERWGYLFQSVALDRLRGYSVRDGRILVAENLEMKLEAPPLAVEWIDSDAARAAGEKASEDFRKDHASARLSNMLLMRGAFNEKDPDETTWTLVYTAPGVPSLFIVVEATGGHVRRTWRG
jgi:hypothetical protein